MYFSVANRFLSRSHTLNPKIKSEEFLRDMIFNIMNYRYLANVEWNTNRCVWLTDIRVRK
jgi:hypothetical protein